jgi:2-oxo-4-hydroxy-4-carboxy-5-ureidoimidazoline decarboxylase
VTPNLTLAQFNALPEAEARVALEACCASRSWADAVLRGRPYRTREGLLSAAEAACLDLPPAGLDEALAGHPRIGERTTGDGASARLSHHEQSGVARADSSVQERLRLANAAYEQRFSRVFLIRAAGRDPEEILSELRRRLGNDQHAERVEVARELADITGRRLEGVVTA